VRKSPLDQFDAKEVEAASKQPMPESNRKSLFILLLCVPALLFAWAWLRSPVATGERVVIRPSPLPLAVQKTPTAETPKPAPLPAPAAEPTLNLTAEMSLSGRATRPANQETPVTQDETLPLLPSDAALEDASHFVRYLDRRAAPETKSWFRWGHHPGDDNTLALGKLRAGYGRIYRDDSLTVRGRNGTAWEEPTTLFMKVSFRF